MTTQIELYSDYICPWCYFFTGRLERLHNEFDLEFIWRSFPLHPETPEEGQKLDIIYARYPYPIEDMKEHLCRNARALDLPYGDRTMTYNSRLAQELGLWAQDQQRGDAFHLAAFRAYFASGKNLSDKTVLLELAQQAELDLGEAERVVEERTYSDAVDRDWQRAEDLGITAVPTLVIGEDKLVGAQEYRSMANFARQHGIKKS
ncbi:MAG: DsbA family oxidoreductase [Desulfobulbaceae bacterium]|nr:MAG: DsbA family oxidoreductase [Desulfobulbaceae bacterium]